MRPSGVTVTEKKARVPVPARAAYAPTPEIRGHIPGTSDSQSNLCVAQLGASQAPHGSYKRSSEQEMGKHKLPGGGVGTVLKSQSADSCSQEEHQPYMKKLLSFSPQHLQLKGSSNNKFWERCYPCRGTSVQSGIGERDQGSD